LFLPVLKGYQASKRITVVDGQTLVLFLKADPQQDKYPQYIKEQFLVKDEKKNEDNYVIINTNDGYKIEGILKHVDKEKKELLLNNVKKYKRDENMEIREEYNYHELILAKEEINEMKLVRYENISMTEINEQCPGSNNIQHPIATPRKEKFDKLNHFYDHLNSMTTQEMKTEANKYNGKKLRNFWFETKKI